ncbi:MAG: serine protease [Sphingomonadales bacterium]|nr:MAG: serine protease [Sphingomonadales bacterium]
MSGIDILSSVPLYVEPWFRDERLGVATGFTWVTPRALVLVTNWHVVSGRNCDTRRPVASHGGVPDRLRVAFPRKERREEPIWIDVPVTDEDDEPLWSEHPVHGHAVDIAAIPIDSFPDASEVWVTPINVPPQVMLKQRIGMPLFILGFPFGRNGFGMPVWKQGSFASEPFLSPQFDRHLIVDTASRPGMSGSPAIQRAHGEVELEDGSHGRTTNGDGAWRFIGIYSGRFHTNDQQDAQLGRVWPVRLVEDVVRAAVEHAGDR